MTKTKILIQLDSDSQVSTFDSVVALDAGVDQLFRHAAISAENVESLVHGAMFTRGVDDLKRTAIFIGGSNIETAEEIVRKVTQSFFDKVRVSVMVDPNGANTTAAAAVISVEQHINWAGKTVAILAGSGPVGQRIAQIIGKQSAKSSGETRIRMVSRSLAKAEQVCQHLRSICSINTFDSIEAQSSSTNLAAIEGADVVFAAGAAGIELLSSNWLRMNTPPSIVVDLNAVPPSGISGVEVFDRGKIREKTICYGAIGVGGLKMKIHKRCLQTLFESNDRLLQVDEIYEIGKLIIS